MSKGARSPRPAPSIWARMGRGIARAFGGGKASYKGAAYSRSKADWTMTSAGPNATVQAALPVLVARHRDLERNDPHIKRAVSVYVHALVGTGLMATAQHDGSELGMSEAAEADAVWRKACKRGVLDVMGVETVAGIQAQTAREWMTGNVMLRRIYDVTSPIGIRVQVLEGDMLDSTKTTELEGGNRIKGGIETNRIGRIVAYWIRTEHPGEASYGLATTSIRVSLDDLVHLKMPGRPGQLMGVPISSPVMATKKDEGDFNAFTLIAKKSESLTVGVVTRQPYDEWNPPPDAGAPQLDENGNEVQPDVVVPGVVNNKGEYVGSMTPGQWLGVEAGTDVRFNNPQIAANYDQFIASQQRRVAVGMNVSYEQATGDFSNANYSTMRGGMLEFWAEIDMLLWDYFEPAWDVVWGWVMEAAWLKGLVARPDIEADWQAPARPSIEPDKDAIANVIQVRAGWLDEDDIIKGNGYHPETLRKNLEKRRQAREKYGIISDADPAKYAWRGSLPPVEKGTPIEGEGK